MSQPPFLWGVATSAYQIEGAPTADGKGPSIWDTFVHEPGRIQRGETGDVACDHYHRWQEDVELMKSLGVNAYRFSIAWTRVLPEGRGRINEAGLDFYDRLVDALLAAGIQPAITLYHWDLPHALQDEGGWPNRSTAHAFAEYAAIVGRRLGDRVSMWMTLNEPFIASIFGYLTGEHAPGIKDVRAALAAAHHLLLAHGLAVPVLRQVVRGPGRIGIALNLMPVHHASSLHRDRAAARRLDRFCNRWYLDPLFHGAYPNENLGLLKPILPHVRPGDMQKIAAPLDFLGVNYYLRFVARHSWKKPPLFVDHVQPEGSEYSLMWEVYPQGLGELLRRLHHDYRPPSIIITENGIPLDDVPAANGEIDDQRRIDFISRHLHEIETARAAGIPVDGYFHWSFMDNFEWALGYKMRFGLVHVDFETQRRTLKRSARWFAERIWNGTP